jgi:hypothetical protein
MTTVIPITIADVPMWCYYPSNIGHIVMVGDARSYTTTACGSWGNVFNGYTSERPKRICKRCREVVEQGKLEWSKNGGPLL